jgi:hypothetical protein
MAAFKEALEIDREKSAEIERKTRGQCMCPLWHSVRKYRITASVFGSVLSRKREMPPDNLVLRIIQPKSFSTPAIKYGIEKEKCALKKYLSFMHSHGHPDLTVTECGVIINPSHEFLGASPDGAVHDPSNSEPYGFLDLKCPYSARNITPLEACSKPAFFCDINAATGHLTLKENHAQVQGQMAIGERPWSDFVVYTMKGISIQRIPFNHTFWTDKLFPKLNSFYDNCVLPELNCKSSSPLGPPY